MLKKGWHLYEFGAFRVDPVERLVLANSQRIAVTGKAFDILSILLESAGHLVSKAELIKAVWPNCFVEEGNLYCLVPASVRSATIYKRFLSRILSSESATRARRFSIGRSIRSKLRRPQRRFRISNPHLGGFRTGAGLLWPRRQSCSPPSP